MRRKKIWSDEDNAKLINLVENTTLIYDEIGKEFGVGGEAARTHYRDITGNKGTSYAFTPILESPYPKYDKPLEQSGDCLVIPDLEVPFHNADFVNRCIELAMSWGITQCNIAGDALHFNSISHWEANWKSENQGDISDKAHAALMDLLPKLPAKLQQEYLNTIEQFEPNHDDDVGGEVRVAKDALTNLSTAFDDIVYVIGNHDGRLLSALNSPMFADQLKQFTVGDNPKYRIAPYYFSTLHTEKGDYSIEHPVSASKSAAIQIASKKLCHVLMGHSHRYLRARDPSNQFWAIQMGMCCDEERMAYVGQRTRGAEQHSTGATIVRGGHPFDLDPSTPWGLYKRMGVPAV